MSKDDFPERCAEADHVWEEFDQHRHPNVVVRWRLIDLSQWIYEEFRITVAKQTLSRELRAMGYRKLSARIVPSLQG